MTMRLNIANAYVGNIMCVGNYIHIDEATHSLWKHSIPYCTSDPVTHATHVRQQMSHLVHSPRLLA